MFFSVYGAALAAENLPEPSTTVDIILVVENTTAMDQRDPGHTHIAALKIFMTLFNSDDRVGIISFPHDSDAMKTLMPLHNKDSIDNLFERIDNLAADDTPGDITNALRGAKQLAENSTAPDKRDMHVVLLTSGKTAADQPSPPATDQIPAPLLLWFKTGYIPVHVVTLGDPENNAVVKNITSVTRGTLINSPDGQPLVGAFSRLAANLKSENSHKLDTPSFKVDDSMNYFRLLVAANGNNIRLTSPSQQLIDASNRPDNVIWRMVDSFTAVTVSQPQSGTWIIKSDAGAAPLPATLQYPSAIDIGYELNRQVIKTGDKVKLSAWLKKNDQPVNDPKIIKFIKIRLKIRRDGKVIDDSSLFPEKGTPERFFTYIQPDQPGDYTFQLSMEDNNFYRQTRFSRPVAPLKPAAQPGTQTTTTTRQTVDTVAEKKPQPQQSTAVPRNDQKMTGLLNKINSRIPHLKQALAIVTIVNGVIILIGGGVYYRRKMKQQSVETVDFLTSISSRDINNAAA